MNVPKLRFKEFNDEWKKITLGNYCNIITKGTTPNRFENKGIRFIKIESLNNYIVNNNKCLYIDEKTHFNALKRSILEEYDVLFAIAGATIGKCGIVKKENLPANTNQALAILRVKKEFLNPYYLLNILDSITMKKYIFLNISVGAQPNINLEQMGNFSFKIPTLKEQDKIVKFLNLINKKIELQSKKIEVLKLYKKYISRDFFDNKNLKIILLKNICNIKKGQQLNNEYLNTNGNYYLLNGGILPSGYTNNYNTMENTISISEGGNSCGYVNFNREKFWSGGHCYTVEPININNEYLFQLLKYYEKKIMSLRVGSGLPNIQKRDLELFKIAIHTQEEQNKISKILGKIDLKIILEENKLTKLESLKKGLMQNMFV